MLLIVEDDTHYARVLCDLSRDKGFKVLVAHTGAEALSLARAHSPTAISLDVVPARHARLDSFESSQAGFENASYSRADAHAR